MLTGALISATIAMQLPGPGSVYLSQSVQFRAPVLLGDTLTVTLTVTAKHAKRPWVTLECEVTNQEETVAKGRRSPRTNGKGDRDRGATTSIQLVGRPRHPTERIARG